MRITLARLLAAKDKAYTFSAGNVKYYRKSKNGWEVVASGKRKLSGDSKNSQSGEKVQPDSATKASNVPENSAGHRENEMKVQMLSKSLYEQIFKNCPEKASDPNLVAKYHNTLKKHGIKPGETAILPDVNIKLPPLKGSNIEEHFYEIAKEQSQPYRNLVLSLIHNGIPKMPATWSMTEGWTKYDKNGNATAVEYPDDNALIFDIEVCMQEGAAPTLACAVGVNHWYSWTSKALLAANTRKRRTAAVNEVPRIYSDQEMITMESNESTEPKVIVGHNISFDRARIKNQYHLASTPTRFLDTMSLHVCVSGITSFQRALLKSSNKEFSGDDLAWSSQTSLNSLVDVYKLYCSVNEKDVISKDSRSVFVTGSLKDIYKNFQSLMEYCAKDTAATYRVLQKLFPLFCERFPHPATLAGMLELGSAYLPVNSNWLRYIKESDLIYEDFDIESKYLLAKRANQACRLFHNEKWRKDLWMWDEDWSIQDIKFKKEKPKTKKALKEAAVKKQEQKVEKEEKEEKNEFKKLQRKFEYLFDTKEKLTARKPLLSGYPAWYRKLCLKLTENDWRPGPQALGTGMQVAPKLLSLCWEGYPLHYIREHGWGFLVPFNDQRLDEDESGAIPLEELLKKCKVVTSKNDSVGSGSEHAFQTLDKDVEKYLGKKDYYSKRKVLPTNGAYNGTGVWCDVKLENCCWFMRLPHKNGSNHKVGNPLARDFLIKFSENVLAGDNITAERIIQIARMLSYWRNNRDRIISQIIAVCECGIDEKTVSIEKGIKTIEGTAAIIPQVVTCGTLTRRAVESTWMTASNAQLERIGSELRGMVQAPEGYRIVGADVDSQELWIASVLGDASETGIHGATPLGWMTLNGTKSNATDMHSVTARAVGITRDHAKVLNYARIYGAGQLFATKLLKQFNPSISDGEAKSKAMKMFALTKGKKLFYLKDDYLGELEDTGYKNYDARLIAAKYGLKLKEMFDKSKWSGGTESAMFNRLEEIAEMDSPVTPFLQCRLSRALEPMPGSEDQFLPTRINWVVQSGAVDFLHLMLVCMRWLMSSNARFCLSFHDEVRYLVKEEHAYKTALAMHLTNLLVRSFCVSRIGLQDLPQSIAFFTSVEVDRCLRKEAQMDCKTPSNPHGLTYGYGVPMGESLSVTDVLSKLNENDLNNWPWHRKSE